MNLTELRRNIDKIDQNLVELLEKRLDVAAAIGRYKKEHGMPVHDPDREAEKLTAVRSMCRPETAEAIGAVFQSAITASRTYEARFLKPETKKFGLIGRTLGHSWSPRIHSMLAGYAYDLYCLEPEELETFLAETDLEGMNVTIPYKKAVVPFCSSLSDIARRIGSVNTLVRTEHGWHGDNTDYAGFQYMVRHSGTDVTGKKALIFGTGGASLAAAAALEDMGAGPVLRVSRSGELNYVNLYEHTDAALLVNTTPLGMVPNTGVSPVDLSRFPALEAVFDVVYNPRRTKFLLDAERLDIPNAGGLAMLVAQARRSAEQFAGRAIADEKVEEIMSILSRETENIILIGMPGSGKTTVGRALASALGRPFIDADTRLSQAAGLSIPAIFSTEGETRFRERETAVLAELGKGSGAVIATGGGCVTRPENYPLLHQNGRIVWIRRNLDALPIDGRPLSQQNSVRTLYEQRREKYALFADIVVDNEGSPAQAAAKILEALQ